MTWTIINKKTDYEAALHRIEQLSESPPALKSEEGKELLLLGYLVDRYEEEKFPLDYPDPIEAIKVRMEELGLSLSDLMDVFGDRGTASKVLGRQRALSLNMIRGLSNRLSLPSDLLIQPLRLNVKGKKAAVLKEPKPIYKRSINRKNNK
ncbi:MAG TPA: transcriptional regulator [Cyclobacteriaceae bacterium]